MKRLVLCADDFAMSEGVSRTIVELAGAGKINAISCMTALPRWSADAALLAVLPSTVEIGLHLVLSDDEPVTSMPTLAGDGHLPSADSLAMLALGRRLPLAELRQEVSAQFDLFEKALGRPPSFVDGHQHTHVLAGIREIVIDETARRAPGAWIRSCEDRPLHILRRPFPLKGLVNAFQSRGLARCASRARLRCNDSFSGLYDFKAPFAEIFPRFLRHGGQFHLVICHPGDGFSSEDSISAARTREAAVLRSMPIKDLAAAEGLSFAW